MAMPSETCTWTRHQRTRNVQRTASRCVDCSYGACAAHKTPHRFGRKTMPNCWVDNTGSQEIATDLLRHGHEGKSGRAQRRLLDAR
eukprot:976725-Amphidinium_carterae.2